MPRIAGILPFAAALALVAQAAAAADLPFAV